MSIDCNIRKWSNCIRVFTYDWWQTSQKILSRTLVRIESPCRQNFPFDKLKQDYLDSDSMDSISGAISFLIIILEPENGKHTCGWVFTGQAFNL